MPSLPWFFFVIQQMASVYSHCVFLQNSRTVLFQYCSLIIRFAKQQSNLAVVFSLRSSLVIPVPLACSKIYIDLQSVTFQKNILLEF